MTTLYLRPNGVGAETGLYCNPSAGEANWQDVDEDPPDVNTYVGMLGGSSRDLYALQDHTTETGTINWIKVWARVLGSGWNVIKVSGYAARDGNSGGGAGYTNFNTQYSTNPDAGGAWTWAQLDALQGGVGLAGGKYDESRCTQVFIEVDYTETPPPTVTKKAILLRKNQYLRRTKFSSKLKLGY